MTASKVKQFQQSLSDLNTGSSVVTPTEFRSTLEEVLEPPAVGAELPFDDFSLSDTNVTLNPSPSQLKDAVTGVSGSRMGIASLGTVAIESRSEGDEFVSLYPEHHLVVLRASDLHTDLSDAFRWLRSEFEMDQQSFVLATGPSSTGDMGALVQGVHGPEQVHVIIVSDHE